MAASEQSARDARQAALPSRLDGPSPPRLGSAMRLMLALAQARARSSAAQPPGPSTGSAAGALWELAERYHPEQAWLAASWIRGDRTLDEIERSAPREPLAPALRGVFGRISLSAQELREQQGFAQR